jgi:4-hydroxy-tetrahydrodipicolinate synthase
MLPSGLGTAIVTPFHSDGSVDHAALAALVEWQLHEGVDFLVACGSTGEAATLECPERVAVVTTVLRAVDGRIPVVAGATDNSTARAVEEARRLADLGVSAIMSASPYYNKPTQSGLEAHFTAIADGIAVPLLLYNVPGRSGVDLRPETVARLAGHDRIGGIKEASGSVRRVQDLARLVPDGFIIFSGDDDLAVPAIAAGARGLISVASNALPQRMAALVHRALAGGFDVARAEFLPMLPFIDALFAEANPIPVKAVLALQGRIADVVRLPLVPATPPLRALLNDMITELESLRV